VIPQLAERVAHLRHGRLTSGDGGFGTFFWLFFGTLVLETFGEVYRQTHGGVGYVGDYTPWMGLVVATLPAVKSRGALHDAAAQRVTHAVVGAVVALLSVGALAHYESLSRDAHTGMGHLRTPTVFATSAAFAAVLVWPLVARAPGLVRRAVPALALAASLVALAAAGPTLPALIRRPEAAPLLRHAARVTELPPPETWPLTALPEVRRAEAPLPFELDARCDRWYCNLRGEPRGASARVFHGFRFPSLLRDQPVVVRRVEDVWFLEQPTGETTFLADGRYGTYAALAGRVRAPDAWLFGALFGAAAALATMARARRVRRRMAFGPAWREVTIGANGTATDRTGEVYAVDVPGATIPAGPALARCDDDPRRSYRTGRVPVLREVLAGDATTIAGACDAWVLECDARALTLAVWGGGSLLAWVYTSGLR
jgi:hypothetical protein